MLIEHKDATITPTGSDDAFPGTFEVILSTPDLDRDGDTFRTEEWQQPLPGKITFDIDHGMSVATTVGSGVPTINDQGQLVVSGTYSSLKQAQDVRTLVNEGHIDRTSVAYVTKRTQQKGGPMIVRREVLNGAFVAIPANDAAKVLASKGLKTGARNNATDAKQIQSIHDAAASLGADCSASSKSYTVGTKAVAGSFEQNQQAVSDALSALYAGDNVWAYPLATFADSVVFTVSGDDDAGKWQADYTLNDDGTATLGTPERVNLTEQITPAGKSVAGKTGPDEEAEPAATEDPAAAAKAAAAVDSKAAADAESDAITEDDVMAKALMIKAAQFA